MTAGARGAGVVELIDADAAQTTSRPSMSTSRPASRADRHRRGRRSRVLPIRPSGSMLVAGISGGGKSTRSTGILERLAAQGYQYCVIDPEGDYAELEGAVVLGDAGQAPTVNEAVEILRGLGGNVVLNCSVSSSPTGRIPALTSCPALRSADPHGAARTGSWSTRRTTCCRQRVSRLAPPCRRIL